MNTLLTEESVFIGFKEAATSLGFSISYLQKLANAGALKTYTTDGGKRKLYRKNLIKVFELNER
jgi:hypothetical protein